MATPNTEALKADYYFHDESALLERVGRGLRRRTQELVFLVGAPLSAPCSPNSLGIPGVDGVIDLIREEFSEDASQLAQLDATLQTAGVTKYQAAFVFLQGRRGQPTANEIIRKAVLKSWMGSQPQVPHAHPDDTCRSLENDNRSWFLAPGIEALGTLIASYPAQFGRSILTTNFDPLLEVSIRRAAGHYFRTTLDSDGNLAQTEGTGCHVIHLHGYWYGSDTLHTPRQLTQPRPRLRASLSALLRDKVVLVCGYGGWDDAFTEALMGVVHDDTAYPEVLWTFLANQPHIDHPLCERLRRGIDRGRITLYSGVDCNRFFPALLQNWSSLERPKPQATASRSNIFVVPNALAQEVVTKLSVPQVVLEGDDEDRPPVIDICVGRDTELEKLRSSSATVIFITGIGGQGKSTIAATYYSERHTSHLRPGSLLVWRDCKEESERFETQLTAIIERLSHGKIRGKDLAEQQVESIIDLLLKQIAGMDVLFVFDNVDHYVDIEKRKLLGSAHLFVETLLSKGTGSRAIFTCRPIVEYNSPDALSMRLEGISLDAAKSLFEAREATCSGEELEDAHQVTGGHAFWLDLMAIQVAQRPSTKGLGALLAEINVGGGPLPTTTLNSIWATLKDREQAVLRVMAETVKPESEVTIADYISGPFNYNKVAKAIRALRSLNLIVVKRRPDGQDLLELHPIVRTFVRQSFPQSDRALYINPIIRVYKGFIDRLKASLSQPQPLSVLLYWTQSAELDIAVGNLADAFEKVQEVSDAFLKSAYVREWTRVTRLLFEKIDWKSNSGSLPYFDTVFKLHIRALSQCGETEEADFLLERYETTVPNRDARYINYCDCRSYSLWFRSAFGEAVEWARTGYSLVEASGIDTKYGASIRYTLALAERDAGRPEIALSMFLDGRQLAEVVNPEELDEKRGVHHYGNIGRCLQFMGQIDSALLCYQKSALLLEKNPESDNATNRAYARTWIGELLLAKERLELARAFLQSALHLWEQVGPPKVGAVKSLIEQIEERPGFVAKFDKDVERICLDWILGRDID